jgi:hypothetical protein
MYCQTQLGNFVYTSSHALRVMAVELSFYSGTPAGMPGRPAKISATLLILIQTRPNLPSHRRTLGHEWLTLTQNSAHCRLTKSQGGDPLPIGAKTSIDPNPFLACQRKQDVLYTPPRKQRPWACTTPLCIGHLTYSTVGPSQWSSTIKH